MASPATPAMVKMVSCSDPFERLLAAQAMADDLILASTDQAFAQFEGVVTLR